MGENKQELLRGTLDLMVLQTLATLGALHGYGIARRLEQVSRDLLAVNQGSLYPALLRLEQRGWVRSAWGASENNRRARYYSITARGRRQLAAAAQEWEQMAALMARLLAGDGHA
ncbi:MAG: PadR family transcriptional regulator [Terriglobales bacterium]